jgi:hypothetical protein
MPNGALHFDPEDFVRRKVLSCVERMRHAATLMFFAQRKWLLFVERKSIDQHFVVFSMYGMT